MPVSGGDGANSVPNEATLRALVEHLPLAVYVERADGAGATTYTSPQLAATLGYADDGWASDGRFVEIVHPDDRSRVVAARRRSREAGEPFRMEYRLIASDGTVRWFLDEATVARDEPAAAVRYGVLTDITERKALEEALGRRDEELRWEKGRIDSLLEISPAAIVTLAPDGTVTSWNVAAEALFGYAREEALGRGLEDLIARPDDLGGERIGSKEELARTGRFQAVTRRTRKDGSLLDVEVLAAPTTVDGEPTGYVVVYHDVTAAKAREEAEQRYRELVEHLPLVTYIDEPTPAASTLYVSPQVRELLGYSPEEWLADRELFPKLLHPEDRERVLADHERVFAAGESSWSFEYRLVARDGRTVWIRDEAVVVRQDGAARYVQGFMMDITKRKTAEDALRESEERFRAMFEEAPIGIVWSSLEDGPTRVPTSLRRAAEGRVSRRNRAYRELLGYTEEELASLHFTEYTHPDDLPRELELYGELREGKIDRFEVEKRYIRRDGRVIWAHVVDSILRDDHGRPLYGLTTVEDVTERKEAEEALRKSEADLRRQTQYYELLLEISPVGIVTLDVDERVTSWNRTAERLFGYTAEEAVGRPIGDLIMRTAKLREDGHAITRESLAEVSAHRITRRMRKDGSLVDVEVLMARLQMDGEDVGSYVIYHDVSELHRQKQYFESLLEISPTAIVTVDLDDRVTSWNPAAERLFGYTCEEALGRKVDELIAASDELAAEAADVNRRGLEGEVEYITRRTRKDGSLVDVQLLVAPIVLEGELVGRYGIYHDISELQRQKRYFQSLLENSPTAIVVTDLAERVTAWNPAAERLFGYTAEEALGRRVDDLVANRDDVRDEALAVNQRVRAGSDVHLITRRARKDGTLVDVEVHAARVGMADEPEGSYAIYHDIGELQRQRQYFESLLANSPSAIAVIDRDGTVTSWNSAAETLFGYSREEAIGRNVNDLVAASEEIRSEAESLDRTPQPHVITRRTRKDGTFVDVELLSAPVVVAGEHLGDIAIYHDIGDLVRARREAEEAALAKSTFLATMSHEIRTPMNAVIGMTELLLDTRLTPEQRSFTDVIRTSGDSLLTIIDDILDFSKIEARRLELEAGSFVLGECVESALDIVAASAAAKGLDVAFLADPDAPVAVRSDPTRLRQILANLLTNAVKFTDAGDVVLSLDCERLAADGGDGAAASPGYRLHFAVRDTGIGIPEDRMGRLFESFSQVDASTTRRYGGTGLGLAISKRLSELMGGTMWVESRLGEGSTFHFTITAEAAPTPPAVERRAAELGGKRLLVVDDNAANREVVRRQTASWGMATRETGSPAEALEWIRRGDAFDVAVLDLQMPELDGLALAREIRRVRDAPDLPLVLLTSLGRRREDLEADIDFAAYLTKPIKASQLYETLVAVFGPTGDDEPAVARSGAPAAGEADVTPLRILLAEDNEVNRKMALLMLARLGYRADIAVNGVEALEALREEPYDVVLMDVEMPEMDGLEASRRIHAEWPGAERPRIVAMTANAMQGDRETCLAAGMDDYLSKPIRGEQLAAALARCTPRAEAPADTAEEPVLDPDALAQLAAMAGDTAFVAELAETFRHDARRLVDTLARSAEARDAEEVRRAAHTLKSSARIFGATRLGELCDELERTAAARALDGALDRVDEIRAEHRRVDAAVAALGAERERG